MGGEIGELVQRGRVLNNGEEMRLVAQLEGQKAVVTCSTALDGSRQICATNSSAEADHDLVGPKKRKPPTYWVKEDNVRAEIMMFWANLGVESNKVRESFAISGPDSMCHVICTCKNMHNI